MPGYLLDVGEKWDANVRDRGQKITEGMSLTSMLFDIHSEEVA